MPMARGLDSGLCPSPLWRAQNEFLRASSLRRTSDLRPNFVRAGR